MAKNTLRSLEISHFRSIKGTVKVALPERGLTLIRSKNLDSGGSSGGGKSTLLLALNALLDCCPYPMTELQAWGVEDPLLLKLGFDNDVQGSIELTRGGKNSFKVGDAKATSGAKAIAEKLQTALGYSPEMIRALTYWAQQDLDDFLTQTNSEKQEFLAALLGLQPYEQAVEIAQKKLKELAVQEATAQVKLGFANERLKSLTERKPTSALMSCADLEQKVQEAAEAVVLADDALKLTRWAATQDNATCAAVIKDAGSQFLESLSAANARVAEARSKLREVLVARNSASATDEEATLTKYITDASQKLAAVKESDRQLLLAHNAAVSRLDTEIASAGYQASGLPTIRANRQRVLNKIEALQKNTCPTCTREWLTAGEQLAKEQKEADVLAQQIAAIEASVANVPDLKKRRSELKFEANPLIAQFETRISQWRSDLGGATQRRLSAFALDEAKANQAVAEAHQKVSEVEGWISEAKARATEQARLVNDKANRRVLEADQKYREATATSAAAQHNLAIATQINKATEGMISQWERDNAQAEKERDLSLILVAEIQTLVAAEQDFIRLIGREGFLGAIFDEVLAEISAETNDILGRVANTAHVTLEFRSEVENKKGTITKEIRPVVAIGGYEATLKSGCSGGMYTAVRLAVRLALRNVIERRTGTSLPWLCLDESFEGLDLVSKEACMEILAEAGKTSLILVVDHSSEFKELFTQFIDLEFKGGETVLAKA